MKRVTKQVSGTPPWNDTWFADCIGRAYAGDGDAFDQVMVMMTPVSTGIEVAHEPR